jgi:hypothetical protein
MKIRGKLPIPRLFIGSSTCQFIPALYDLPTIRKETADSRGCE